MTSPLSDFAANQPKPAAGPVPRHCPGCGHDFHSAGNCSAGGRHVRCGCERNMAVSLDPPFDETLAEKLARLEAENKQLKTRAEEAEDGWHSVPARYGRPGNFTSDSEPSLEFKAEPRPDHAVLVEVADTLGKILMTLEHAPNSAAREGAVSSVQIEETAKGPRVTVKLYAGSVAPVEEAIEDFGRGIRLAQEGQVRAWAETVDALAERRLDMCGEPAWSGGPPCNLAPGHPTPHRASAP